MFNTRGQINHVQKVLRVKNKGMVRHEGTKHRVEWPDKKNEGVIALCNYFPNLYKRFIKTSGGTTLTPTCRYLSDSVPKQR